MKKSARIYGVAAAVLLAGMCFSSGAIGQDKGLQVPAEPIIIEGKKPATFNHQVHMDLGTTCGQCHHDAEHKPLTDEDIKILSSGNLLRCASCHNEELANEELRTVKAAFHARCKDCHSKGVDGKTGPTKCNDCHVQKKQ